MKKEKFKSFDIIEDGSGEFYLTAIDGNTVTFLHEVYGVHCYSLIGIKRVFRGRNEEGFCNLWKVLENSLKEASKSFNIIWEKKEIKELTVKEIGDLLGYEVKVVK